MSLPRYRVPMCGWPKDARHLDCGCVRTGIHWHLCDEHLTELRDELSGDFRPSDAKHDDCTCGRPGLPTAMHLTPCQLRDDA